MSDTVTPRAAAEARGVSKIYGTGDSATRALDNVDLQIGSGKSTLMHVFAGLDNATHGTVIIGDTDITHLILSLEVAA